MTPEEYAQAAKEYGARLRAYAAFRKRVDALDAVVEAARERLSREPSGEGREALEETLREALRSRAELVKEYPGAE